MALVLQKNKQAKTRVDLKRKSVGSKNGNLSCSVVGTLKANLQFNAYLFSKIGKVHDFMPDLKVDRYMPVTIDYATLPFYLQRTKLLVRTEANLQTNLSSLTISLRSPLIMLAYF